jgi:hypothetical protein
MCHILVNIYSKCRYTRFVSLLILFVWICTTESNYLTNTMFALSPTMKPLTYNRNHDYTLSIVFSLRFNDVMYFLDSVTKSDIEKC